MSVQTAHHLPTTPSPLMQRHVLARVEEELTRRYAGTVPAETVRSTVREVAAELKDQARLTTFLPALTQNEAARRLQQAAHAPVAATTEYAAAA